MVSFLFTDPHTGALYVTCKYTVSRVVLLPVDTIFAEHSFVLMVLYDTATPAGNAAPWGINLMSVIVSHDGALAVKTAGVCLNDPGFAKIFTVFVS